MFSIQKNVQVGVASSLLLLASSGAFAQTLSCESKWVDNNGAEPHCFLAIMVKGMKDKIGLHSNAIPDSRLESSETCDQLCQDPKRPEAQEHLVQLLFKGNLHLGKQMSQVMAVTKKLKAELEITNQIAGNACVKAEKLQLMLKMIVSKASGGQMSLGDLAFGMGDDDGDDEDKDGVDKANAKAKDHAPDGMYL
jgi:hypothetical protein